MAEGPQEAAWPAWAWLGYGLCSHSYMSAPGGGGHMESLEQLYREKRIRQTVTPEASAVTVSESEK